jgi:hypothetical protein
MTRRLDVEHRWLLVLFAAVASCAPSTRRESSTTPSVARAAAPDSTPEAVALLHGRALIRRNWQVSAALTHPAEVARVKAAFLPIFLGDTSGLLARRVLGAPPQLDLASLSDVDFYARLWSFQVAYTSRGTALDRFTEMQIVGVARPFPDTAYVVYRFLLPANERPIRGTQSMKLQFDRGRWWLAMLSDFESLREMLSSSQR